MRAHQRRRKVARIVVSILGGKFVSMGADEGRYLIHEVGLLPLPRDRIRLSPFV
jgi:hypothetical protein